MRNKKLFKRAIIITALSVSMIAGGCGKQAEEVISESVEEVAPTEEETPVEKETEESPEDATPPESPTNEESVENKPEALEAEEVTEEESKPDLGYTVIPMEDTQMFATSAANIRKGPSTEYDKVGSLSYAQEITVNGKVDSDGSTWYVIKTDSIDDVQMVSGSLLSTTQPQQQQTATQQPVVQQPEVQQPVVEDPIMDGGDVSIEGNPNFDENGNYAPINPATGQPYKEGELTTMGTIWQGDHSAELREQYW